MNNFVIAIDGLSAAGKGTLAKALAQHFCCSYLPTGNLYRLVAKKALGSSKDLIEIARNIDLEELDDTSLSSSEIATKASEIAQNSEIRAILNQIQKNWITKQNIAIIEGRDIGTTICPDANVKLFLTANIEARAKRRYIELQNNENHAMLRDVMAQLSARDQRDSTRASSPLKKADDAVEIDSSNLNASEVFHIALSIIEKKLTDHRLG